MSKNSLIELPGNFGELVKLKRLDLFQNNLEDLPESICKLINLQWLDLKANPIQEKMQAVVGDCLKPVECQRCAKNVSSSRAWDGMGNLRIAVFRFICLGWISYM